MKNTIILISAILTILIVVGVILFTGNKNENRTSLKIESDLAGTIAKKEPDSNMESPPARETVADREEISAVSSPRSNYFQRLSEMEDNQKDEGYRIVRADEEGFTLELSIPDYRLSPVTRDDQRYQQAAIPGYFSLEEPGRPALPAKIITIPLPGIETVEVTATSSKTGKAETADLLISSSRDRIRQEIQEIWERKIRNDEQLLSALPPEGNIFSGLQAKINSAEREKPLKSDGSVPSDVSDDSVGDTYPAEIVSGTSYWLGEEQALNLLVTPLQYNRSSRRLSSHSRITVEVKFGKAVAALPKQAQPDYGEQFALANSDSFKAFVYQDGIHTITYQNLVDAGFNVGEDPRALRMYFMGQEIPIYLAGEDDGSWNPGDFIDFYGEKNTGFYSQTNVYWLYQTTGSGTRMAEIASPRCGRPSRQLQFLDELHLEENVSYQPYLPVGEDESPWFWAYAGYTYGLLFPFNTDFILSGVSDWKGTVSFTGHYFGFTHYDTYSPDHHTRVYINGILLGDWTWDGETSYTFQTDIPQSAFNEGTNTITTEEVDDLGLPITGEFIFIDYFDLTYYRDYESTDDHLSFTASRKGDYRVNGFAGENNALAGINIKIKLTDFIQAYGQYAIDDPKQKKYAYQVGMKIFDVLHSKVKNLQWYFQAEYNAASPRTYSHAYLKYQTWTHYNQELATPFGADFAEIFLTSNITYKNFLLNVSFNKITLNKNGTFSDVYMLDNLTYLMMPDKEIISHKTITISYIINRRTDLQIYAGADIRITNNTDENFIMVGVRTSLSNFYYDF